MVVKAESHNLMGTVTSWQALSSVLHSEPHCPSDSCSTSYIRSKFQNQRNKSQMSNTNAHDKKISFQQNGHKTSGNHLLKGIEDSKGYILPLTYLLALQYQFWESNQLPSSSNCIYSLTFQLFHTPIPDVSTKQNLPIHISQINQPKIQSSTHHNYLFIWFNNPIYITINQI